MMELFSPSASMFEPATYRICIVGMLDNNWSDYSSGLTIEHSIVLDQYKVLVYTKGIWFVDDGEDESRRSGMTA
jgi:hypothetical protein